MFIFLTAGNDLCEDVDTTATSCLRADGYIYLTPQILANEEIRKRFHGGFDLPRINQNYNMKKYR